MNDRCASAVVFVLSFAAAGVVYGGDVGGDVIEKPAREGVQRLHHTAHWAGCLWSQEPHEHGPVEAARGSFLADSVTIIDNGPVGNRIDLVVVGDGYTAGELGTFAAHAQRGIDDLFTTAPYDRYGELFNVHRVEVISNESGVTNDPNGVDRDTALDMRFYCGGTARALCVSTGKAIGYAENAPDWDQIFAVANSSTYGGVGYPSLDIGTYSGGNDSAPQVAIHELGHALGDLADEYTYGGPVVYTGGEPAARNVSVYPESEMAAEGRKWAAWLGENDAAYDGLVSTYEGGQYSEQGIYRPTDNSMMRALGRPFNQPSAEGMIIEMWKIVAPIDDATPNDEPVGRGDEVRVWTAASFLKTRWYLNGEIVGAGRRLNLATVDLPAGESVLEAEVWDDTDLVRDQAARDLYLTQRRQWVVSGLAADLSGDGVVDAVDLAQVIAAWGTSFGDVTGDGQTDAADLAAVVAAWG